MIEAARTQLAAITAVTKFWAGWAESADKYSRAISQELTSITDGEANSKEAIARLSDLTREYLRELTELPNAAVRQFSDDMEKLARPRAKRARNARAKD
jgi:hypothetical protein